MFDSLNSFVGLSHIDTQTDFATFLWHDDKWTDPWSWSLGFLYDIEVLKALELFLHVFSDVERNASVRLLFSLYSLIDVEGHNFVAEFSYSDEEVWVFTIDLLCVAVSRRL